MFTTNTWPLSHAWLHCLLPPYHFPAIWLLSSLCFTLIPHCLLSFYPSHLIYVLSPLTFSPCLAFPRSPQDLQWNQHLYQIDLRHKYNSIRSLFSTFMFLSQHSCSSPLFLIVSLSFCISVLPLPLFLLFIFATKGLVTPLTKSPACKKWRSTVKVG